MAVLIFRAARITSAGGLTKAIDTELVADAISCTSTECYNHQIVYEIYRFMSYIIYNYIIYIIYYLISFP